LRWFFQSQGDITGLNKFHIPTYIAMDSSFGLSGAAWIAGMVREFDNVKLEG
jgi:hypothetical protein